MRFLQQQGRGCSSSNGSKCSSIGSSSKIGRLGFSSEPANLAARGTLPRTRVIKDAEPQPRVDYEDPEKTFGLRRLGNKAFGKSHTVSPRNTISSWVTSIWTRNTLESRKHDELLELVVLNERLAGRMPAWEARRRLEYLKKRRSNWEAIYNYITTSDAAATLELVEEANRKVGAREGLNEDLPRARISQAIVHTDCAPKRYQ